MQSGVVYYRALLSLTEYRRQSTDDEASPSSFVSVATASHARHTLNTHPWQQSQWLMRRRSGLSL